MSHSIMCIAIVSPHALLIPGRDRDVKGEENTSLNTRSFSYLSHHSPLSLIIMSRCIQCCSFPPSVHVQTAGPWRRDHGLYAIPSFLIREAPALGWSCNLYKPLCERTNNQTGWPISCEIHLVQYVFSQILGGLSISIISKMVKHTLCHPR